MKQSLIDKYNVPVPRYTSYPPANYFHEVFDEAAYKEEIIRSNEQQPAALSFYFHVPYCRRLCFYCGCNAYPMADKAEIRRYVDALHREIDMVIPLLDPNRPIAQIHYGGGTPTVLPPQMIRDLNDHLLEAFPVIDHPEIAIECHPGWLQESDWTALHEAGFNRFSLGIQDFNDKVLSCVNRKPSLMPVDAIVSLLHALGARVNMDFLYGLPHQSAASFAETIRQAVALSPDRLVTFSYAHVPWVNKRQLILEQAGLPSSQEKQSMFDSAREILLAAGYEPVGMDHFVKPDDELAQAVGNKQLHRNFQGYCTRRTTGQVYAFGVTGISQLSTAYAQNTKDIETYMHTVEQGHLPVCKGYALNDQEQKIRLVIEQLMCNNMIDWNELSARSGFPADDLRLAVGYDTARMDEMQRDGVITLSDSVLQMTDEGKAFVRNVAAALDPLVRNNPKSFSKPI